MCVGAYRCGCVVWGCHWSVSVSVWVGVMCVRVWVHQCVELSCVCSVCVWGRGGGGCLVCVCVYPDITSVVD